MESVECSTGLLSVVGLFSSSRCRGIQTTQILLVDYALFCNLLLRVSCFPIASLLVQ